MFYALWHAYNIACTHSSSAGLFRIILPVSCKVAPECQGDLPGWYRGIKKGEICDAHIISDRRLFGSKPMLPAKAGYKYCIINKS